MGKSMVCILLGNYFPCKKNVENNYFDIYKNKQYSITCLLPHVSINTIEIPAATQNEENVQSVLGGSRQTDTGN